MLVPFRSGNDFKIVHKYDLELPFSSPRVLSHVAPRPDPLWFHLFVGLGSLRPHKETRSVHESFPKSHC